MEADSNGNTRLQKYSFEYKSSVNSLESDNYYGNDTTNKILVNDYVNMGSVSKIFQNYNQAVQQFFAMIPFTKDEILAKEVTGVKTTYYYIENGGKK